MWWQSLINGFLHKFYLLINFVLGLISSLFGSHFRNGSSPAASSSRTNNNPFRTLLQNRTFRLDNGTNIRINSLIAEGGFAFVYAASCVDSSRKFACKVMNVHSDEQRCSIEKEILIHTTYGKLSENILSLVDSTFIDFNDSSLTLCLLLLPYVPNGTLRCHIDTRLNDSNIVTPWRERELLEMFRGVCEGVNVLHNGGEKPVTHRDIKPENILINSRGEPILMDFGGVEFGEIRLKSRADALKLVDNASSNSTMSYRAPELFEMGCSHHDCDPIDERTDIWSLGCLLFAMAYGQSPFECVFMRNESQKVKVVDCGYLRVIGKIPKPPQNSPVANRYSTELGVLIEDMLNQERRQRLHVKEVIDRINVILNNNCHPV